MYIVLERYGYIVSTADTLSEAEEELRCVENLAPNADISLAFGSIEQVDGYDIAEHNEKIRQKYENA